MAIAAAMQWDVRTTGSDSNGGGFDSTSGTPGTDYSQQDAAQTAFTDLVIGATTTQLTSAAHPFTSAAVGNVINITAGTGFTVGRYQVMSVSGSTATMDRAVGTAASAGGTGNLGGGLLTIATANSAATSANTIHIKAGTYTLTASITVSQSTLKFIGYQATHRDGSTKPLITTATNSVTLFNTGSSNSGVQVWDNLSLSNTATTRASGIWQLSAHGTAQQWVIVDCLFDGFNVGIDSSNGTPDDVGFITIVNTEVKNCTTGYYASGTTINFSKLFGCYFHGNAAHVFTGGSINLLLLYRCIFATSTGSVGLNVNNQNTIIDQCTFANNSNSTGVVWNSSSASVQLQCTNSIFYGNTGTALINGNTGNIPTAGPAASRCNAFGSNGTNYASWSASKGDVTLTASPFTNSASGDFSLNSVSGGGAACKGAGFPGAFAGGTSTGHADIGAIQSAASASAGGGSYPFIG